MICDWVCPEMSEEEQEWLERHIAKLMKEAEENDRNQQ